jgi:hypothetical protein
MITRGFLVRSYPWLMLAGGLVLLWLLGSPPWPFVVALWQLRWGNAAVVGVAPVLPDTGGMDRVRWYPWPVSSLTG